MSATPATVAGPDAASGTGDDTASGPGTAILGTDSAASGPDTLAPGRPLRVLALVKQIPVFEDMELGPDGRLVREGLDLHMNDYCRRGVAQGLALARASGGSLAVLTLGPPAADTVCREAIAFGADIGYHVTDPAFAGSDTLATARALAAAVERLGPFDVILAGRNSVDADTGQVPPQVAQLLDLPFACGVRRLGLDGERLRLLLEHNDEWVEVEVGLPALLSCAERLIDPCKIKDPVVWAGVDAGRIRTLSAADLGAGPWGTAASPTSVGPVRTVEIDRMGEVLAGPLAAQVDRAMAVMSERGALQSGSRPDAAPSDRAMEELAEPAPTAGPAANAAPTERRQSAADARPGHAPDAAAGAGRGSRAADTHGTDTGAGKPPGANSAGASSDPTEGRRTAAAGRGDPPTGSAGGDTDAPQPGRPGPGADAGGPVVAVLVEPDRPRLTRELIGAASGLAAGLGGEVTVLGTDVSGHLDRWGADRLVHLVNATDADDAAGAVGAPPGSRAERHGGLVEEDVATAVTAWARLVEPWAILAPSTAWGREVASRTAAAIEAGLTGDAVGLSLADGRLVALKPAFGGHVVAAIECSSAVQMATVRAGVLELPTPGLAAEVSRTKLPVTPRGRVRVLRRSRDDDGARLAHAEVVIGVGQGVDLADYDRLFDDARRIGAQLCATRKVTDVAAMPRARQVGITGHSIAPRLYIAIGLSGKFNHTVGVRSSGMIVAVNPDPTAPIFDWCDVGFVADWRDVFDELIPRLEAALSP